jgi:hypothetical protein
MATEAAWLNGNRLTERRKRKCALTATGLLMEGLSRLWGILKGHASQELIHNSSLLGRRVKRQGRVFWKAGPIEVRGYEFL